MAGVRRGKGKSFLDMRRDNDDEIAAEAKGDCCRKQKQGDET